MSCPGRECVTILSSIYTLTKESTCKLQIV